MYNSLLLDQQIKYNAMKKAENELAEKTRLEYKVKVL